MDVKIGKTVRVRYNGKVYVIHRRSNWYGKRTYDYFVVGEPGVGKRVTHSYLKKILKEGEIVC